MHKSNFYNITQLSQLSLYNLDCRLKNQRDAVKSTNLVQWKRIFICIPNILGLNPHDILIVCMCVKNFHPVKLSLVLKRWCSQCTLALFFNSFFVYNLFFNTNNSLNYKGEGTFARTLAKCYGNSNLKPLIYKSMSFSNMLDPVSTYNLNFKPHNHIYIFSFYIRILFVTHISMCVCVQQGKTL